MYPLISLGMLLDSNLDGQPNDCDIFCLNGKMTADPDDDGDSVPAEDDATPLLAGTPCTEYYDSNVRRFGVTDGTDGYYDLDFAQEGSPMRQKTCILPPYPAGVPISLLAAWSWAKPIAPMPILPPTESWSQEMAQASRSNPALTSPSLTQASL